MTVASRPYHAAGDDTDWLAVRDLLVRTHAASPPGWNWDIRHWDGTRFHNAEPRVPDVLASVIGLWEDDGILVGAIHGEGRGDAYLELDPDYRHLQPELLDWAEARLAAPQGRQVILEVPAWDYDLPLRDLLRRRGYAETPSGGWLRWLRFGGWAIPEPRVAAGYRTTTTSAATLVRDGERMAELLNAAFGRTMHSAAEYRTFMTMSPSFRHDLNLVAEAPDGSLAAHVGLTLDEVNGHGIIEPVCTHPDHRQRGLAQALMLDGLRRLRDLGARSCHVETGDMGPANALYRSIPFTEEYRGHAWRRDLGMAW